MTSEAGEVTPEERKAIAKRMGWRGHSELPRDCERFYPRCCAYHEGFDTALGLLVPSAAGTHYPVYAIEEVS